MSNGDIALIIFSIIGLIISYSVLCSMTGDFLKAFEKSCKESIRKRDEELDEKEKMNKELRRWLFK